MFVAIDDTYGTAGSGRSRYITANRRSHVAVLFRDDEVDGVRAQLLDCLTEVNHQFGLQATEFHFVDIYNRVGQWRALRGLDKPMNLAIFSFFAEIYARHKWKVRVQTVDDRTIQDHPQLSCFGKVDGFDMARRDDLSLLMLLMKIRREIMESFERCTVLLDEGRGKPAESFGAAIFSTWPAGSVGRYASSSAEPLLQICDFMAFCINRSTHLATKDQRSEVDQGFLEMMASMPINSPDLSRVTLSRDFTVADVDRIHEADRTSKDLGSRDQTQ
jgi:hypothetical protein